MARPRKAAWRRGLQRETGIAWAARDANRRRGGPAAKAEPSRATYFFDESDHRDFRECRKNGFTF